MSGNARADRRRDARAPRSEYQRAIDPLRLATLELTDFTGEHRMLRPASGSASALDLAVAMEWTGVLTGTGENVSQFANLSLVAAEESLRAMAIVHGDRRAFVIADKVLGSIGS
jgi:hypothetical protein